MAKGYWIAHVKVADPTDYPKYVETAKPAFEEYGATFLARGGDHECVEGDTGERHVVIEFPSKQAALDCYYSDQYQKAAAIRQSCSVGTITIVEGAD